MALAHCAARPRVGLALRPTPVPVETPWCTVAAPTASIAVRERIRPRVQHILAVAGARISVTAQSCCRQHRRCQIKRARDRCRVGATGGDEPRPPDEEWSLETSLEEAALAPPQPAR
eukprot:3644269-Pleurochrysis_carterae.AAC.2